MHKRWEKKLQRLMILTLENKFHHYKSPIFKRCRHRDINIILVSSKISSIQKKKTINTMLITRVVILKLRVMRVMMVKLNWYNLWLNTTWDKVSADTKKEFNSKPVHNKNFLKTTIKSYCDDFHNKEIT